MMKPHSKLKQQQELLRIEIVKREGNIRQLGEQLEENFGSVVFNSILPVTGSQRNVISNVIDTANSFLGKILPGHLDGKYDGLLKSAQMIVTSIAWRYIKKLIK